MSANSKPLIKVKGKVQDMNKKEKNVAPKRSAFLLTINTQQRYKPDDKMLDNDIDVFSESVNSLLNSIDQFIVLKQGDVWDDKTIKDVNIDFTIERSLKSNCLHVHILINIEHFSTVKLNYSAIKTKIQDDLGLPNIYLNNRVIKNAGNQNIMEYLNKFV